MTRCRVKYRWLDQYKCILKRTFGRCSLPAKVDYTWTASPVNYPTHSLRQFKSCEISKKMKYRWLVLPLSWWFNKSERIFWWAIKKKKHISVFLKKYMTSPGAILLLSGPKSCWILECSFLFFFWTWKYDGTASEKGHIIELAVELANSWKSKIVKYLLMDETFGRGKK